LIRDSFIPCRAACNDAFAIAGSAIGGFAVAGPQRALIARFRGQDARQPPLLLTGAVTVSGQHDGLVQLANRPWRNIICAPAGSRLRPRSPSRSRATFKSGIAYGPALVAGTLLAVMLAARRS
jgi:hypothetical protein